MPRTLSLVTGISCRSVSQYSWLQYAFETGISISFVSYGPVWSWDLSFAILAHKRHSKLTLEIMSWFGSKIPLMSINVPPQIWEISATFHPLLNISLSETSPLLFKMLLQGKKQKSSISSDYTDNTNRALDQKMSWIHQPKHDLYISV